MGGGGLSPYFIGHVAATSMSVEKPRPRSLNPQAARLVVVGGGGVNLAIWGAACLRLTVTPPPPDVLSYWPHRVFPRTPSCALVLTDALVIVRLTSVRSVPTPVTSPLTLLLPDILGRKLSTFLPYTVYAW